MTTDPLVPVWLIDLSHDWVTMPGEPEELSRHRPLPRDPEVVGFGGRSASEPDALLDLLGDDISRGGVQMAAFLPSKSLPPMSLPSRSSGVDARPSRVFATLTVRIGPGVRSPYSWDQAMARSDELPIGPVKIERSTLIHLDRSLSETTFKIAATAHPGLPIEIIGRTTEQIDLIRSDRMFANIVGSLELV